MFFRWRAVGFLLVCAGLMAPPSPSEQKAPPASGARILLLPRHIVSGEPATLAVLDGNGRLTPGVRVNFSDGEHVVTNTTGRALFVAPPNPGVIYATIGLRSARVYTTILTPAEVSSSSLQVSRAPQFASLADRFELAGKGLCGDADANTVRVGGKQALILASSRASLIALPPATLEAGPANIEVGCANRSAAMFSITFLDLSLNGDSSPLAPGEHRTLTVDVRGSTAQVPLEAVNLSPKIAEVLGGNPAKVSSSGGQRNTAHFELVGRERGNFLISVRLVPTPTALPR
jgi:hypothetical protein